MTLVFNYFRDLIRLSRGNWNRFWFTPQDPATLSLIRIAAGAMLFYTHLVWTLELDAFFGPNSWLSLDAVKSLRTSDSGWSLWWLAESPVVMWGMHLFALGVFACLTVGLFSKPASILAWIFTLSYAHRAPTALYGLDQVNGFLSMYLMFGQCGARYSLDAWLARRRNPGSALSGRVPATVGTNISLRLIQLHMCVVYFFAGISKLQGPSWWDGTAFWGAIANAEYQTLDLTWLVHHPRIINVLTHVTILWEIFYCVTVWNRWTRPLTLLVAIPLHLGIAFGFGMITFGVAMLIANMAFVPAWLVRAVLERQPLPETPSGETARVIPAPKMLQHFPKRATREPLR
ncbi:MAG: HTTM domain-containing protein [Planctomycetales bacterium]